MKKLNLTNFNQEVESANVPCVIKFYKDTCWMCQELRTVYKKLERNFRNDYKFYTVDDEESEDLGTIFEIDGVPSIYVYSEKTGMREIPFPEERGYTYDYLYDFLEHHDYL